MLTYEMKERTATTGFSCDEKDMSFCVNFRDTMDSVKQSAALCLLRLYRTSPDLVSMGDWTARVVHLLNDQHLVGLDSCRNLTPSFFYFFNF